MPTEWMAMDSPPSGQVDHHRPALDAVGGEDRHLGLVDDRQRQQRAVRAGVGDRERAAGDVVGRRASCDRARLARSLISRAMARSRLPSASWTTGTMRPLKSRSTAMPRLRSCARSARSSPNVALTSGNSCDGVDDGPGDERQVGEAEALLRLPRVLVRPGAPARRPRSRPRSTRRRGPTSPSTAPCARRCACGCWCAGRPCRARRAPRRWPARAGRRPAPGRGGAAAARRRRSRRGRGRRGGRGAVPLSIDASARRCG